IRDERKILGWCLVVLPLLVLHPADVSAQKTPWETHMDAGREAEKRGHHTDAERSFQEAIAEGERFGVEGERLLPVSLFALAGLYDGQGRYVEAQRLLQRSLAVLEEIRSPDDPFLAAVLLTLGSVHRIQGQYAEAEPLLRRSLAILEKAFGP